MAHNLTGTISDLWDSKDAGRVGLSYILAPFLGPTLGPLIGAYTITQHNNDWKYAIWVVLMILAPVGLAIIFMQETSKSRILYLRAKRRGTHLNTESTSVLRKKIGKAMLKPLHMCLFEVYLACITPTTRLICASHSPSSSVSIPPLVSL